MQKQLNKFDKNCHLKRHNQDEPNKMNSSKKLRVNEQKKPTPSISKMHSK